MVVWPQLVKDHMVDWDILRNIESLQGIKYVCMSYLLVGGQT